MIMYRIIEMYGHNEMEKIISDYLNDGWKLNGSVSVVRDDVGLRYLQAIIKEVKVK